MKNLNLIGIEDDVIEIYDKSSKLLAQNFGGRIVSEEEEIEILDSNYKILASVFSQPQNFRVSNIVEISFTEKSKADISFLVIDRGMSFSPKYGQIDLGFDYQVWGYYPKDLGGKLADIIPKNVIESSWLHKFLNKILGRETASENTVFNRKYEVCNDSSSTNTLLDENLINEIVKFDDLNVKFGQTGMIAGFFSDISTNRVLGIAKLFSVLSSK